MYHYRNDMVFVPLALFPSFHQTECIARWHHWKMCLWFRLVFDTTTHDMSFCLTSEIDFRVAQELMEYNESYGALHFIRQLSGVYFVLSTKKSKMKIQKRINENRKWKASKLKTNSFMDRIYFDELQISHRKRSTIWKLKAQNMQCSPKVWAEQLTSEKIETKYDKVLTECYLDKNCKKKHMNEGKRNVNKSTAISTSSAQWNIE